MWILGLGFLGFRVLMVFRVGFVEVLELCVFRVVVFLGFGFFGV